MKSPLHAGIGKATVLVTGGAGFIGSNFIRYLRVKEPKAKIVCLDLLTYAGSKRNLRGIPKTAYAFVKGDVADPAVVARVFKNYRPQYVVHFAAESHVDRSIHESAALFARTNVVGTTVLLEAFRRAPNAVTFLQVSTDEVYGSLPLGSKKRFTESTELSPNSPYAASKAAADLVARSFFATYGTPVVITRCSNNYGPYQHAEKLIPFQIARLKKGEPIALYGDGKNVRDWIHVEDHCAGILAALVNGRPGEVYNIGADDQMSNLELAKMLLGILGRPISHLSFVADRPGHDRRYAIDASKIRRELGWKPRHSLASSFENTVRWYVAGGSAAQRG